ncbi:MAG: hypothetical protein HRU00_11140 [Myxococcales bacterium]|nr:hypothetical protein [Myxococcales bacterium]
MDATAWIVTLWIAFGGTHMLLSSSRLRPGLVRALGAGGFLGIYSLVSLATFVPLVWVYFANKHAGSLLWAPWLGPGLRWGVYLGMTVAFVLMAAALIRPSPASISAPERVEIRGIHRLTRHGLFMGLGLFGLLHLLANGFAADVAFFAGFPIFAVIGSWHQDSRKRVSLDGYREFCAKTPFLPFTGRETLRGLRELSPIALAIGVAVTVALRWYHQQLF